MSEPKADLNRISDRQELVIQLMESLLEELYNLHGVSQDYYGFLRCTLDRIFNYMDKDLASEDREKVLSKAKGSKILYMNSRKRRIVNDNFII